jgi:hypothetical protein
VEESFLRKEALVGKGRGKAFVKHPPSSVDHDSLANQNRNLPLDQYDVQYWFWRDPASCVRDSRAQEILRKADHPFRIGVFTVPRVTVEDDEKIRRKHMKRVRTRVLERIGQKQSAPDSVIRAEEHEYAVASAQAEITQSRNQALEKFRIEQDRTWWCDAVNCIHAREGLPIRCAERLADYLSGFQLVPPTAPIRRSEKWRKLQRVLGKDIPSVNAPQQEPLDNRLLRLMADEVQMIKHVSRPIALLTVTKIWVCVLGNSRWHKPRLHVESLKRIDRRSRDRVQRDRSLRRTTPED